MADNTDNSPVAAAAAAARNENNVSQTTNPADASIHSSSTAPRETSEPMTTSEPNPTGASIQSPSTAPKETPAPTTTTSEQNSAPQLQQQVQVDTDVPGREQADKTVEPGDDGPKHPVENAPDDDSEETKQHKAKGETWTGASWIKFDKVKPGDPEMSSGKELEEMETQKEKEEEAAAAQAKGKTGAEGTQDTGAKKEGILGKVQEKLGHHSK